VYLIWGSSRKSMSLIWEKFPKFEHDNSGFSASWFLETQNKNGSFCVENGTDANVFLTVFGSAGESGERKLESSSNNFVRNQTDNFGFDCVDLGELQSCVLVENFHKSPQSSA